MTHTATRRNLASREYLSATVRCNVPLDFPVEIAAVRHQPTEDDWMAADWVGDEATTREARTSPWTPPGTGTWKIFVRLTATPEIPVLPAGSITVSEGR